MKYLIISFLTYTLIIFSVQAESYHCEYEIQNNVRTVILKRKGSFFNDSNGFSWEIDYENNELLFLKSYNLPNHLIFISVINKKLEKGSTIGINPGTTTAFVSGDCKKN